MPTLLLLFSSVLGLVLGAQATAALNQPTRYVPAKDACPPSIACESSDVEALAINLIHYRVEEAKRAQAAKKLPLCHAAAHAALSITAGLYSNRKYEQSQKRWLRPIRTRFAGDLPEKQAIDMIDKEQRLASTLYKACGGPIPVPPRQRPAVRPVRGQRELEDGAVHGQAGGPGTGSPCAGGPRAGAAGGPDPADGLLA